MNQNSNHYHLYRENFQIWFNLALSNVKIPLRRFLLAFFVFLFLFGPKRISYIPIVSAANAQSPKLIASMNIPTIKRTHTEVNLNKQKIIIVKEQSNGVKIELFDDLQSNTAGANVETNIVASQIPLERSVDIVYDRFIRQSFFNNFFLNSKVSSYHTDMFKLLFSLEERSQYQNGTYSRMNFLVRKYFETKNIERQLPHKIAKLWNVTRSSLNLDNSMFRLHRYVSSHKSPLERQISHKRFCEPGHTKRTNVHASKIILDFVDVLIPDKYSSIKNTIQLINNSSSVGWFSSTSISRENSLQESKYKHWRCFVHQKYYMIQQITKARRNVKKGLSFLNHKHHYPTRVMNCFELNETLSFPNSINDYPPKYRVTNNLIWDGKGQAKSIDSGQFYEFHLLDYGAAFFKKEAIWTNYLRRYGDLTVHGTISSKMHQHFGEIDINFDRMGFDILRAFTEKASSKSTAIANLKPILNLVINSSEKIFKYRLKLCLAHYRSLPINHPDQGLTDLNTDNSICYLPKVPSFNFNISMENGKALRLDSFVSICDSAGRKNVSQNNPAEFCPELPPTVRPWYSKTFADWYIYKGVEISYVSIYYNLFKFFSEI